MKMAALTLLIAAGCAACLCATDGARRTDPPPATQPGSFAVVELFTSEGCSSCPPADALLAETIRSSEAGGRPVYALSFHVDYWNRLGWTNRFSDAAYSRRQMEYGRALKLDSAYTPQTIVNGVTQFVGSDARATRDAIDQALNKPPIVRLSLIARRDGDHGHTLDYTAVGAPAGSVLNVAVVERDLTTDVGRGENSGHTLRHQNVVRWFKTFNLPAGGVGQLPVRRNKDVHDENAELIAYVQAAAHGAVLGALKTPLPRAP